MNGTVIEIFLTYESIDEDPACAGTALEMALVRTLRQRATTVPQLCHPLPLQQRHYSLLSYQSSTANDSWPVVPVFLTIRIFVSVLYRRRL
jgi:hypothetical protein